MILDENFKDLKTTNEVNMKCDYCELEFKRIKYSVNSGRKIISKDCCSAKKCIVSKRKESNIIKYGVSNPSQNKEIKKKQEETLFKRHGVKVPAKSEIIKNKMIQTNISKYGNASSLHGKENKIKTIETWNKKYGCDHPFSAPVIREKINKSMEEKYGKHYTQTKDYLEKTKKTCIERYGKEHHSQSESTKIKRRKTNQKKYGFEYPSQNDKILKKIMLSGSKQKKIYGKTQKEIKDYLSEITGLSFESIIVGRKEIDIFNPINKIGIEYCGLRWHNENSPEPRDRNYHFNKYQICKAEDIRLITIFEDEWIYKKNQCKSYLRSIFGVFKQKIFARKCIIKEVNKKISNKFYLENHLFGKPNSTKVSFGIFYEDNMIGCMSLGSHHRDCSKITLNRLCFKEDIQVMGGVSKMFKRCVEWCMANKHKKIITWSDNRWSTGLVYEKIGFKLDKEMSADYSYVDLNKKYSRLSKQSQKKSNSKCPKDMTEKQWSETNNLSRIWDCGKKRWIFEII